MPEVIKDILSAEFIPAMQNINRVLYLRQTGYTVMCILLEFFEDSVGRIARKIIFKTEEKPVLRALPLIPFEICEWSYNHKVGANILF